MIKLILTSTILTTIIMTSSMPAFANEPAFQVAVVKGAIGSNDIMKGNIESGIKKLTGRFHSDNSYEKKMSLCVAYLKSNSAQASESACTAAITSIDSLASTSKKALYLRSLNYSNRGVSRYKSANLNGALSDFKTAILIDSNPTTEINLKFIEQILSDIKIENTVKLSD